MIGNTKKGDIKTNQEPIIIYNLSEKKEKYSLRNVVRTKEVFFFFYYNPQPHTPRHTHVQMQT